MNELIKNENIENMIYEIRGMQVMLDSDLARIYKCKNGTKEVNQAVKNNIEKFPERFSWKLTNEEISILRSKNLTTNISSMSRSNPRVFTEQGVYMLSTILKTKEAVEVTINIMDAFVKMRKYISNDLMNNKILVNHENRLLRLEEGFDEYKENTRVNTTYYQGQFYDTYSLFLDILFKGVNEIIIIDNYAGLKLLDMIKHVKTNIIIISKNIDNKLKEKYKEQYHNVTFIYNNTIHDRYIILDRCKLYHCGMSFKDLGKSTFSITEFDNKEEINEFIDKLNLDEN